MDRPLLEAQIHIIWKLQGNMTMADLGGYGLQTCCVWWPVDYL